jgi:hypothetical protein
VCACRASSLAPEFGLRVEVARSRALQWLPRLRITLVSAGNLPQAQLGLKLGRPGNGSESSRKADPGSFSPGLEGRPTRFSGYSQCRCLGTGRAYARSPLSL